LNLGAEYAMQTYVYVYTCMRIYTRTGHCEQRRYHGKIPWYLALLGGVYVYTYVCIHTQWPLRAAEVPWKNSMVPCADGWGPWHLGSSYAMCLCIYLCTYFSLSLSLSIHIYIYIYIHLFVQNQAANASIPIWLTSKLPWLVPCVLAPLRLCFGGAVGDSCMSVRSLNQVHADTYTVLTEFSRKRHR